jgi:hypothetical protein
MALHNIMTLTATTHIEELLELEDFAGVGGYECLLVRRKQWSCECNVD